MSKASQFSGGLSWFYRQQIFPISGTFTALRDGWYTFSGLGGAGSGAALSGPGGVTGGSACGFVQKRVYLLANQSVTITIGAGGASVSTTGAGVNGNDGNDTTIVGPGFSLVAGKGKGGVFAATLVTAVGPAGGVATGGDVNVQGGKAGDALANVAGNSYAATGGAAPGIFGAGMPSGNATVTTSGGGGANSGGASPGGKSADNLITNGLGGSGYGGGAGGPSTGAQAPDIFGSLSGTLPTGYSLTNFFSLCWGMSCNATAPFFDGGGGYGGWNTTAGNNSGGAFCGGGAVAYVAGNPANPTYGGKGKWGGGGGAAMAFGGYLATSGKGGDGVVCVEY